MRSKYGGLCYCYQCFHHGFWITWILRCLVRAIVRGLEITGQIFKTLYMWQPCFLFIPRKLTIPIFLSKLGFSVLKAFTRALIGTIYLLSSLMPTRSVLTGSRKNSGMIVLFSRIRVHKSNERQIFMKLFSQVGIGVGCIPQYFTALPLHFKSGTDS